MSTPSQPTPCSQELFSFTPVHARKLEVDFSGGYLSSDAGALLLREVDKQVKLTDDLAKCFVDFRNQDFVEHHVGDLLRQRLYGIALGYEDINDHDTLRNDPLLATACDHRDILGEERNRQADKGKALAGKSTLNRLELAVQEVTGTKKIQAQPELMENLIIEKGVAAIPTGQPYLILDFDNTDDTIHGDQEGRFYHGYYKDYCYLPLYCFCGDIPLWSKLSLADKDGSTGTVEALKKIVPKLRERFGPEQLIIIRGDSGFCRDALLAWIEEQPNLRYIIGMARNKRLETILRPTFWEVAAKLDPKATEAAKAAGGDKFPELQGTERAFHGFTYRTQQSWTRERSLIGKAEITNGKLNPRFVITNLTGDEPSLKGRPEFANDQAIYEQVYCGRGNMENRIKEQQMDMFADRTSTAYCSSNQLRLWFSTLAYMLVREVRTRGLHDTDMAAATVGTIRLKLFKIAAQVQVSVRRVYIKLRSAFTLKPLFAKIWERLSGQQNLQHQPSTAWCQKA